MVTTSQWVENTTSTHESVLQTLTRMRLYMMLKILQTWKAAETEHNKTADRVVEKKVINRFSKLFISKIIYNPLHGRTRKVSWCVTCDTPRVSGVSRVSLSRVVSPQTLRAGYNKRLLYHDNLPSPKLMHRWKKKLHCTLLTTRVVSWGQLTGTKQFPHWPYKDDKIFHALKTFKINCWLATT